MHLSDNCVGFLGTLCAKYQHGPAASTGAIFSPPRTKGGPNGRQKGRVHNNSSSYVIRTLNNTRVLLIFLFICYYFFFAQKSTVNTPPPLSDFFAYMQKFPETDLIHDVPTIAFYPRRHHCVLLRYFCSAFLKSNLSEMLLLNATVFQCRFMSIIYARTIIT